MISSITIFFFKFLKINLKSFHAFDQPKMIVHSKSLNYSIFRLIQFMTMSDEELEMDMDLDADMDDDDLDADLDDEKKCMDQNVVEFYNLHQNV